MSYKMNLSFILIVFLFISCENVVRQGDTVDHDNKKEFKERTRQVHLDFHTSEQLENIGSKFSKQQFQEALKAGNVNSINIFAKGHHGWSYYPSEIGEIHPNLDFDLLGQQIEACHEIGVTAQAYFTVGWSVKDALEHPEWIVLDKDGKSAYLEMISKLKQDDPLPWGWALLSPEGDYLDLIVKQTEELAKNYAIDGVWYDIVNIGDPNYNELSMKDMLDHGIDPDNFEAANKHHVEKMNLFFEQTSQVLKKYRPEASLFYNWSTHVRFKNTFDYAFHRFNTKQDLEDLPTTWEGYDVFPWRAKYFYNTGKPIVGMSGKFHTSWGEFGGFKHKDALLYEAASMVSMGAAANFGDQLHPSGEMEMETYRNIGYAFDYVEKIEDYGVYADHLARTGLMISFKEVYDKGVVKMLLENQVNFVVVNNLDDWSDLEVIILSGGVTLNPGDISRINEFVDHGGKLLVLGNGLYSFGKNDFQIDLGVEYLGNANYDKDYTLVGDKLSEGIVRSPFLNYEPAIRVKAKDKTEILASIREPYFSRTLEHFTSHQHTPYKLEDAEHPAAVKYGNIIYIPHELDKIYFEHGARIHRDLFYNALRMQLSDPLVETDMPSGGRMNLLHQHEENRYVVHLLYGPPMQRGRAQVIEDLVPLYDVPVRVNFPETIKRVYTVPDMITIKIDSKGNVVVPKLECHTAIVFEY